MKEHAVNKLDNFICGWYSNKLEICDDLIQYHQESESKLNGLCTNGYQPDVKKSTDVQLLSGNVLSKYINNLIEIVTLYTEKYPMMNSYGNWGFVQNINIQHYAPSEGFYAWHTERTGAAEPMVSRHMVFMTYLNDLDDGGQTEFYHQKLAIKPEKGLTLIWPSDWTFTHRGIPSMTQEKYITTGWINYIQSSN